MFQNKKFVFTLLLFCNYSSCVTNVIKVDENKDSLINKVKTISKFYEGEAIPGMIGKFPKKLNQIISQLKKNDIKKEDFLLRNRALLHGPHGNGKSTIAAMIAKETGAKLYTLNAPSIMTPYIGSGPEAIKKIFDAAEEYLDENKKAKVIIFFDEIDAIAAYTNKETRVDHKACVQELWLQLDKYKSNHRMFFFFATNDYKHLNKTFLDRFASNVIEIKNPDYNLRIELLTHFFFKANIVIDAKWIQMLALKTSGLSTRSLEDFVNDLRPSANNNQLDLTTLNGVLGQIKSKNSYDLLSDPMEKLKQLGSASLYILRIYELLRVVKSIVYFRNSNT